MSFPFHQFAYTGLAVAQDDDGWEHQSDPQDLRFRDDVETWNEPEVGTGRVPSGSALAVCVQLESTRVAEGNGVGHRGLPDGLAMTFDPLPDTGEIIADASPEMGTCIRCDVDVYSWESESDRRGTDVAGQLIDTVSREAWVEPRGGARPEVSAELVGRWNSSLDLVASPVFKVCVDLVGCWDPVDLDLPIPLASDNTDQVSSSTTRCFPLPVIWDLRARHGLGTIDLGWSAVIQLPIENIGALDSEGVSVIEGSAGFPVYPEHFQAGSARTDGVGALFTTNAAGELDSMRVLRSNDPLEPVTEMPLSAAAQSVYTGHTSPDTNSASRSDAAEQVGSGPRSPSQGVRTQTGGCSCASSPTKGSPARLLGVVLGGSALRRRRRTDRI